MLKREKTWNLIGIIVGIAILLCGIKFMVTPPDSYSTDYPEDGSFGADYYTYQYKATRQVAINTSRIASNIRELGESQASCFGFLFIAMGALTIVHYGKKLSADEQITIAETPKSPEEPSASPEEAPTIPQEEPRDD